MVGDVGGEACFLSRLQSGRYSPIMLNIAHCLRSDSTDDSFVELKIVPISRYLHSTDNPSPKAASRASIWEFRDGVSEPARRMMVFPSHGDISRRIRE
jgi:hypothetical protein